jgi:hypothetical protein
MSGPVAPIKLRRETDEHSGSDTDQVGNRINSPPKLDDTKFHFGDEYKFHFGDEYKQPCCQAPVV